MSDRLDLVEHRTSFLEGNDLDAKRKFLEQRLEDGYQRIDQGALAGSDVLEWESFWIRLLDEYQDVCRELDEAA